MKQAESFSSPSPTTPQPTAAPPAKPNRDASIESQCLTKVWAEMGGEVKPEEILSVYKEFLNELS